jgi:hypothetical protein
MKRIIYLLILPLLIFSCDSNIKKESPKSAAQKAKFLAQQIKELPKDTIDVDPSKIECIPTAYSYGYNDNFSPGTFGKITYVYNSTKSSATVIDRLPFNCPVNILKEYPDFFLVCTPKARSGYIKKTDLYFHSVFWGLKSCTYLFGISKYPEINSGDFATCKNSVLKVVKLNESKQIVDVYKDSIAGVHYDVKLIYNSALKNAEAIFYLNYSCYNELGYSRVHFIVDNGKKLSQLIVTGNSGDGGFSETSTVYMPITLMNGKKILLAKNGSFTVDETKAKVELYPYPTDCGIPINELIVVVDESIEPVEEGEPEYNSDGTMAEKITARGTTYYQWNGNSLRKIKTIHGK